MILFVPASLALLVSVIMLILSAFIAAITVRVMYLPTKVPKDAKRDLQRMYGVLRVPID